MTDLLKENSNGKKEKSKEENSEKESSKEENQEES